MDGFPATIAENDFAKFGVIEIQSADSNYLPNVLPIRLRPGAIRRLRGVEFERGLGRLERNDT